MSNYGGGYISNIVPTITISTSDDEYNHNNGGQIDGRQYDLTYGNNNNNTSVECDYTNGNNNGLCLSNDEINMCLIPISVLRQKSRDLLSKRLNSIKVIPSENGIPRDWRGVLQCTLPGSSDSDIQSKTDPMKEVLDIWYKEEKQNATLGRLLSILGNIDRWDVVDDTHEYFAEDSKNYLRSLRSKDNNNSNGTNSKNDVIGENALTNTTEDGFYYGKSTQKYDAFILFANEDVDFATQIIDKLESHGLMVYVKERDLAVGTFENDAIMQMISNCCEHLIVILSKAFFKSAANTFFLKYAQWQGITQDRRKVIPCVFEPCDIPPSLSFYSILYYYQRQTKYFNFWNKLLQSLQPEIPQIVITEIDTPKLPFTLPIIEVLPPDSDQSSEETSPPKNTLDTNQPQKVPRKRKDKSKSPTPSGSPTATTTTSGIKQFLSNLPKIGSQSTISSSMWTLRTSDQIFDKENERCHSSLSLNNSISSPTQSEHKKKGWYSKLLSPNTSYKLSAESDSSLGTSEGSGKKKKKWYRKRFRSRSKNREPVKEC